MRQLRIYISLDLVQALCDYWRIAVLKIYYNNGAAHRGNCIDLTSYTCTYFEELHQSANVCRPLRKLHLYYFLGFSNIHSIVRDSPQSTMLQELVALVAGLVLLVYLLLQRYPWLKYDWKAAKSIAPMLIISKRYVRQKKTIYDIFAEKAEKIPTKTFLIFQDNNYSYDFMMKQMNKIARVAYQRGIRKGDVVALLMHNEPAFIWTLYGTKHRFHNIIWFITVSTGASGMCVGLY